jgi:thiol-disulfide isomerase/thioredoxin
MVAGPIARNNTMNRLAIRSDSVLAAVICLAVVTGCQRPPSVNPAPEESKTVAATGPPASLPFGESLEEALAVALRDKKRVLVYFTGDYCGWCRRMEAETHSDRGVIDLASKFVCVKVNVGKQPSLQERYSVYSIPRTLVMTADGSPVDERVGFQPPAEHAPWLEAALAKELTTWPAHYARLAQSGAKTAQPSSPAAPAPVGADQEHADLVLWFVEDDPRKFDDASWVKHAQLIAYLGSKGFRPRIEHLYRWSLSERWDQAQAEHRLSDLIVCSARNGLFRKLMKEERVADVISTRLKQPGPLSVCTDFKDRWIWSVQQSPHAKRTVEAIWSLFEPREGVQLGPPASFSPAERREIDTLAKNAALWWSKGDLDSLRPRWDEHAPQRAGTAEGEELRDRKNYRVRVANTRLFGTGSVAIALVETQAEGELPYPSPFVCRSQRFGTPTLAMLHRTPAGWRILAVGLMGYDITVESAAELFGFTSQKPPGPAPHVAPAEILAPADRATIGSQPFKLEWRLPQTGPGGPQYWLVQTVDDHGWVHPIFDRLPSDRPIGHREHSFQASCTAEIWTFSADGGVAFSQVRHWLFHPTAASAQGNGPL